ncbi:zinc-binding alcohol dehydrogenase family protein [Flagellimonas sp. HMM57]|uniref:zinc-binding alcohol dehydrogenase family protein n=1 Tax=unclassified Flagellimonas TaxID=2644544 RepID=UPI0013D4E368|nr:MULTISPECIES: zinc-binding alcohol dehydrogenase family protein [unclassified Flagellimonas]UII75375.1 zinc-binding alcohol dehydrogenase family protein [Flagellimonas sp. HMM57]
MKYLVCKKPGTFLLKEKEYPIRNKGEALLKINKVGICGTDLHAYAGRQAFFTYPRILGHELAAEVLEIDENPHGIQNGDKVVIMPYLSCGTCVACRTGKTNCCTNISVLGVHSDGGMQEQITVPVNVLLPAKGLSDDHIVIVEPLAIGAHAIRRANIQPQENIAVIGCGPIGIGLMKLAQIARANVIALDINEERLRYAKEKIGVDHVVNVANDPIQQIVDLTNGDMCTAVFDASGHKGALESGIDYMSHGGRFVLVGLSKGELTYKHPAIHAKETTIMCSRNATTADFEHVINVLDKFPVESFITHNVPFTEMIANFDNWLDPKFGVMKATVDF